jgi:hypothetical protein
MRKNKAIPNVVFSSAIILSSSLLGMSEAQAGFGDFFKKVVDKVENVVDVVADIGSKVEDAVNDVGEKIEDKIIDPVKDVVTDIGEKVEDKINDVGSTIDDKILQPIKNEVEEALAKVGERVLSFADLMIIFGVDAYLDISQKLPGDVGDQLLGEFFKIVLKSDDLTDEMLRFAEHNTGIIKLLMHTVNENPELLDAMALNLERDVKFGQLFTGLAVNDEGLALFFFDKINTPLYKALTIAMVNSRETSNNVGILMEKYGADELKEGRPFFNIFFDAGTTENDDDGNEIANQRMFYALMAEASTAAQFMLTLQNMDLEHQQLMLEFAFEGIERKDDGSTVVHANMPFFNSYAIINGLSDAIAASAAKDVPDFDLSTVKLQDLSKFAPFMFKHDSAGNIIGIAKYAGNFFRALRSAEEVWGDEAATEIMDVLRDMIGYVGWIQVNQNAPEPLDIF